MKLLFELHKDNLELACAEVEALTGAKAIRKGNLCIVESMWNKRLHRLAFTRRIFQLIEEIPKSRLADDFARINFNRFYKDSYCLRVYPQEYHDLEIPLAKLFFRSVKQPVVNLKTPGSFFAVFVEGDTVYITRLLADLGHDFEKRKAHKRPGLQPISLHPKVAAAMVNLTGIKSGTLLDPCAGTGGILIEAGLMGLTPVGIDIDDKMVGICIDSLSFYKLKAKILHCDARSHKGVYPYVVADLPYSKNTKSQDLIPFYKDMLSKLIQWKTKTAVLGFPDFIDYSSLIKEAGFKIQGEFTIYLHKSLSKKIVCITY